MTPTDLIADLRSRINPAYAATLGTESYERRICAETLEALVSENERLRKVMLDAWTDTDWLLIADELHEDQEGKK